MGRKEELRTSRVRCFLMMCECLKQLQAEWTIPLGQFDE